MDINQRLIRLNERRRGLDLGLESANFQTEVLARSYLQEKWQQRAFKQPFTRYALGAMGEVGPDYTRICLDTALRLGRQLRDGLAASGISADFELQGSVPLNVHIRGSSDVDLLVLRTGFVTYSPGGALHRAGRYHLVPETSLGALHALRSKAADVLKAAYPAVTIDTKKSKCIALSGGSLPRKVDVVPSHWNDTLTYQTTLAKKDRGVVILDTSVRKTLENLPFLHIHRIDERCQLAQGGLRSAIRLVKNLKEEAKGDGAKIELPSFELAALMYHADINKLAAGKTHELAVVAEAQRHLAALVANPALATSLMVPDGSRTILDSEAKLQGLKRLSQEVDELVRHIAQEQQPMVAALYPDMAQKRRLVESARVA